MKLIFLDIDDVLVSIKSTVALGTWPHPFYPSRKDDVPGQYITGIYGVDKVTAGLVNRLAAATDSHIVISSTWRLGFTLPYLVNVMGELGIEKSLVIGKTDRDGKIRGDEIARFVEGFKTHPGRILLCKEGYLDSSFFGCTDVTLDSYVIIDDSSDMTPEQLEKHYVHVEYSEGLSLAHTVKAGAILSGDPKFEIKHLVRKKKEE
jgi:hypothetical protein